MWLMTGLLFDEYCTLEIFLPTVLNKRWFINNSDSDAAPYIFIEENLMLIIAFFKVILLQTANSRIKKLYPT